MKFLIDLAVLSVILFPVDCVQQDEEVAVLLAEQQQKQICVHWTVTDVTIEARTSLYDADP